MVMGGQAPHMTDLMRTRPWTRVHGLVSAAVTMKHGDNDD